MRTSILVAAAALIAAASGTQDATAGPRHHRRMHRPAMHRGEAGVPILANSSTIRVGSAGQVIARDPK